MDGQILNHNGHIIINKKNMQNILRCSDKKFGMGITRTYAKYIEQFLKNIKPQLLYGMSYWDAVEYISMNAIDEYKKEQLQYYNGPTINAQEYLKNSINDLTDNENPFKYGAMHHLTGDSKKDAYNKSLEDVNGTSDRSTEDIFQMLVGFIDPENIDQILKRQRSYYIDFSNIALPHTSIFLDNFYSINSNTGPKWTLNFSGDEGRIGDLRIRDSLHNIILMRICPFWIPVIDDRDIYYKQITLSIKELSTDSIHYTQYKGINNDKIYTRQHHFIMDIENIESDRAYLVPRCNTYIFHRPHVEVSSLTLELYNPYELYELGNVSSVYTLSTGAVTTLTGDIHNLAAGDLIYIEGYTSSNSIDNNNINDPKGFLVSNVVSITQFEIDLDTSGLPNQDVKILFAKNRFSIQMEFVSLEH